MGGSEDIKLYMIKSGRRRYSCLMHYKRRKRMGLTILKNIYNLASSNAITPEDIL